METSPFKASHKEQHSVMLVFFWGNGFSANAIHIEMHPVYCDRCMFLKTLLYLCVRTSMSVESLNGASALSSPHRPAQQPAAHVLNHSQPAAMSAASQLTSDGFSASGHQRNISEGTVILHWQSIYAGVFWSRYCVFTRCFYGHLPENQDHTVTLWFSVSSHTYPCGTGQNFS